MTEFTKDAQKFIDRLKALNYDEPHFNKTKVIKALKAEYEILGLEMPEIEVAENMIVGFQSATSVGVSDRRYVSAWDAAWGAARDAAWDAARDAAWGAAWGAAWDAAWGAARDAAWGAARDAAWDAARGAARDAAWDAAWGAAVRNSEKRTPEILKFISISEQQLIALENGLGFYFPMQGKLILVPIPRMIMVGEALHYDHGAAVSWKDEEYYFLRGVKFDKDLYWKVVNQDMSAEETLLIPNSDQRMAAISMLKADELLKQMNAKLIDTGVKGTRLYEVKKFMGTSRTEYCMLMDDASTDRQFIEWTPPEIGKQANAELCQAHAFGIPLEDWLLITEEA